MISGANAPAILIAVVLALACAYPLAALTLSVPDRGDRRWYVVTSRRPSRNRIVATGAVSLVLAVLAARASGWSPTWPGWVLVALVLAALTVIDAEHHRLPDRLVFTGYVIAAVSFGAIGLLGGERDRLVRALIAGGCLLVVFVLVAFIAPAAFGLGDVKLLGLLGFLLGWVGAAQVLTGLFAGFVLGAMSSLALIAARRASLRSEVAFGPALIFGALLVAAFT